MEKEKSYVRVYRRLTSPCVPVTVLYITAYGYFTGDETQRMKRRKGDGEKYARNTKSGNRKDQPGAEVPEERTTDVYATNRGENRKIGTKSSKKLVNKEKKLA